MTAADPCAECVNEAGRSGEAPRCNHAAPANGSAHDPTGPAPEETPEDTSDSITILTCKFPKVATKTVTRTGDTWSVKDFDEAKNFRCTTGRISNIAELAECLTVLAGKPDVLVIRGEPIPGVDVTGDVRKTSNTQDDGTPPTFREPEGGHRHFMIDLDKVRLEEPFDSEKPERMIEFLISKLPPYFHDVSCFWQLSSKAGLFDPYAAKAHLWFWSSRPIRDAELKAIALTFAVEVDTSLFHPVQAHFTAAPVFVGAPDPLPRRCGLLRKSSDTVAIAGRSYEAILDVQLGDDTAKGGKGFDRPIFDALLAFFRAKRPESDAWLVEDLQKRVRNAPKGHERKNADRYSTVDYLTKRINDARGFAALRGPVVDLSRPDLGKQLDIARGALTRDPDVFVRTGVPCTVDGLGQIADVGPDHARERLSRVVTCISQRVEGPKPVPPSKDFCAALLAGRKFPGLREIVGVSDLPILRRDGTIFDGPGYDAASKWLVRDGLKVPPVGDPDLDQAREALGVLRHLFLDFCVEPRAAIDVFVSAVVTGIARSYIPGPVPAHAADATRPRSGKTLSSRVTGRLVLGRDPAMLGFPEREEKRETFRDSLVRGGARFVVLDNLDRELESPTLECLFTSELVGVRPFHSNDRIVDLPWRGLVLFTGNGITSNVRGALRQRILCARIVPLTDHPERRTGLRYTEAELLEQAIATRGAVVHAALTLLRAHARAGCPSAGVEPLGGFDGWRSTVAAAIAWAGGADVTQFVLGSQPAPDDEDELVIFKSIGVHQRPARDLLTFEVAAALSALLKKPSSEISARVLGIWLAKHERRVVGGLQLQSTKADDGIRRFWTTAPGPVPATPPPPPPPPPAPVPKS